MPDQPVTAGLAGLGAGSFPMPEANAEVMRAAFRAKPTAAMHDLLVELGLRNR
jgi:hypothetical protein